MTEAPDNPLDPDVRILMDVPAPVAVFDAECRYIIANPAWADAFALTGTPPAGAHHDHLSKRGRTALSEVLRRALSGEKVDDFPIDDAGGDPGLGAASLSGQPRRDGDGTVTGVVASLRLPAAPRQAARRLVDPLTGLVERQEFGRHIHEALADPGLEGGALLLIAVSLENLRNLAGLHGSETADQLVKIVAERLLSDTRSRLVCETGVPVRGRDVVGRLGLDQFGIVCGPPAIPTEAAPGIANRLLRVVQKPITLNGCSFALAANIGYLLSTPAHRGESDALRDLDVALQRAQSLGPGHCVAWEPLLTREATRRYALQEQLRRAFDNGEFTLHYQPVLRLSDDRIVGAEALLRWNHPSEGLAPTAAFVPALEELGLMAQVGCWVAREAVQQVESWRMLYGRDIVDWVSVNLSPRQFDDPSVLLACIRSIYDGGFSVHRLTLEITENALQRNPEATRSVLAELGELGVRFAIDDFGAGFASLNTLRLDAVDTIKIDGEFVAQIGTTEGDKLLQALLGIARIHDTAIIAEGIETPAQRDFLRRNGCGFGQGYLLAEPMDGATLGAFALTHALTGRRQHTARGRLGDPAERPPALLNPPTSAGRSQAG